MRMADAVADAVAVLSSQGTLIISGALSGALVLAEMAELPAVFLLMYSVSMLLILSGLAILARLRAAPPPTKLPLPTHSRPHHLLRRFRHGFWQVAI